MFGIFVKTNGVGELKYTLTDHLGSLTGIVNATTGNVEHSVSFDAWGKARTADWKTDYSGSLFADRGFTGHEHLPSAFGLIDMNGRMYDPVLGRFLSPDPYVQDAGYSQSFNRYSYCLNNPLLYTDPSGYVWGIFKPFVWLKENTWDKFWTFLSGDDPDGDGIYTGGLNEQVPDWVPPIGGGWNSSTGTYHYIGEYNVNHAELRAERYLEENVDEAIADGKTRYSSDVAESQGGVALNSFAGIAFGVAEEVMFSEVFNTWMGKDGKIRSQNWGGNGATGGKFKFAGRVSKGFKIGGWVSGAYGIYSTNADWQNNKISTGQMMIEQGSNGIGFIPIYGTAWSFGWNLGKYYGPSTWGNQKQSQPLIFQSNGWREFNE